MIVFRWDTRVRILSYKILPMGANAIEMLVRVLAPPLPVQLPVNGLSSGGWPKALIPCTQVGALKEAPGSQLKTSTALAFAGLWGMS